MQKTPFSLETVARQIRHRPRLATAVVVGVLTLLFAPWRFALSTRLLVAWDVGTGLYLVLAWIMMARAGLEHMRRRATLQDDGAIPVLVLTIVAALASLAAIVIELVGVKAYPPRVQSFHLALAGITVLFSWFFVHTAFALHYAHDFYVAATHGKPGGLEFPGEAAPGYWDFLYFSFVIGTTSQTADVSIASAGMRRLALVHGIVSFFFNATLLALIINIAAGLT
jgi:uncharacterized membrane protein